MLLKRNIVVDLNNASVALLNPDTKEPNVFYKISKWAINQGVSEAAPLVTQASGGALYGIEGVFEKVSVGVEKYKTQFYKRFFNAKYEKALSVNTKAISASGKIFKYGGKFLKAGGKLLNVLGTAQLWYSILNTSPGPLPDEEIRKATLIELKKFENGNASSNANSPKSNNDEQPE